jgi:hypothetical protein
MLMRVRCIYIFRANFHLSGTFRAEGLPLQRARVRDRPVGSPGGATKDALIECLPRHSLPFSSGIAIATTVWNAWRFFRLLLPSESPSNTLRYTTHRQTSAAVGTLRMVMAAILAPGALRMVTLPRRPHQHDQQHPVVASNPAGNPDEPAQGCVGSFLFNGSTCFHQQSMSLNMFISTFSCISNVRPIPS